MHCHGVHSDEFFTFLPKQVHNAREARLNERVYQEQVQLVPSAQPYARYLERMEELKSRNKLITKLLILHRVVQVEPLHACVHDVT